MSTSTANVTPTNIPLTPMRVSWNGVDLGGTTDNVHLTIKYETADIMVDQFGKSIIDKVVSGLTYSVKFVLAEAKNMDNWKVVFQSAHLVTSGSDKAIYSDMQIGDHLYPKAKQLILHPLENADADLSQNYLFYKAICTEASEIKYGPDKQSGLACEFIIFPDTTVSPARYMFHGDPSIGLVSASAAAAVAATGNTGNGVISSIVAYSGYTATETVTVKCVGASSGNDFYVSGSVTGPLGEFHVNAANGQTHSFVCPEITFTMTQGSVQFAFNDSFTIATTAANYS